MRRLKSPLFLVAASAACLMALGGARAETAAGPIDRCVAAWMGLVGVIGAADEVEEEADTIVAFTEDADEMEDNTFAIDGEDDRPRPPHREHRDGDRTDGGRRHHRGDHPHGGRHMTGPPMHGPHHPGTGKPGGPDGHHPAMRAFHEIIRRLGRIEEKLGIEAGPPAGPRGERPWGPPPEMRHRRGDAGPTGRPRPEMSEEMRRQMKQRMEQSRERMEQARAKFQEMEERIKQLEAEVERLKAPK